MSQPLGPVVQSFFVDGLLTMKGLRPSSVKSYRDGIRLFLRFVANEARRRITQLTLADLTFERVLGFVRHLEEVRHNHARTRNQRLALLHTFFEYLAVRDPEMIAVAERVAAIPPKRVPPPETRFLERDEVAALVGCPAVEQAFRGREDDCPLVARAAGRARASEGVTGTLQRKAKQLGDLLDGVALLEFVKRYKGHDTLL